MQTSVVGLPVSELDTPALLVDLDILEANIAAMAADLKARGCGWRPHSKANKRPWVASRELAAGAIGITCAKLGEAEVMVAGGVRDILISNQVVGPIKTRRLAAIVPGLETRLDQPIGSLSGGQRQIVTLVMATWHRPELLLLDEHTAALDPAAADRVVQATARIVREGNLTALMVTHSLAQAASLGDRLLLVHRGRIAIDASGAAKRRLGVEDLADRFDRLRRADQLDDAAARTLAARYA